MPRLIGTAGHVDHGKTTLIRALTGIDADRLPEEQRRGMTIDVGFAYLDTPEYGRVSIVDVPGHERFLTNMLVGALGIDVALLCVAADEGVKPQTREHFQILELLPVEQMVVALTRADLADEDTRALATMDVRELLAGTRFEPSPIVEVSATTGSGLDELRRCLVESLARAAEKETGPWYLPVDRVFTVKGYGTVVTGTLAGSAVADGAEAVVEPGGLEVRVRGVQSHDAGLPEALPGTRVALNLGGVRKEDLRRGMTVAQPGAVFETSCLDADLRWVAEPKHGARVRVSIGADEAMGKIFLSDHEPGLAQLRLETPVAAAKRQPLIVRRYSPPDLIGGGRVRVPVAEVRRRTQAPDAPLPQADNDEDAVLALVAASALGLPTEGLCRRMGRSAQALGGVFESLKNKGLLLGFAGWWTTPEQVDDAAARLVQALDELHAEAPAKSGVPRERAVMKAGLPWSGKHLDRFLSHLAAEGRIVLRGTELATTTFRVKLNPRQREMLDRAIGALDEAGVNTPAPHELARTLGVPIQAVEDVLRLGIESGEIVRVAQDVFYSLAGLEKMKESLRQLAGGDRLFTAGEFRDTLGTSRKYAIALLEHFDAVRVTVRVGDRRGLAR